MIQRILWNVLIRARLLVAVCHGLWELTQRTLVRRYADRPQVHFLAGQSHVSEPAVNLGDNSFLDGPAGPGFVVEQIGDAAHDGKIADSAGNAVPGAGAVNSISGLTHIAWLNQSQVLGGCTEWNLSSP